MRQVLEKTLPVANSVPSGMVSYSKLARKQGAPALATCWVKVGMTAWLVSSVGFTSTVGVGEGSGVSVAVGCNVAVGGAAAAVWVRPSMAIWAASVSTSCEAISSPPPPQALSARARNSARGIRIFR